MSGARPSGRLISSERLRLPRRTSHCIDRRARSGVADSRKQKENPIPAHLVARVFQYPQESEHILDVRRLEEFQAAPFLERNLPIGKLDLEIGRHVAGAKENS